MTIGLPGQWPSYPERQALYPVSVRQNKFSSTASFRFPVTRDTLAFDYEIPVITALKGLGVLIPLTLKIYYMPGTPNMPSLWDWGNTLFEIVEPRSACHDRIVRGNLLII